MTTKSAQDADGAPSFLWISDGPLPAMGHGAASLVISSHSEQPITSATITIYHLHHVVIYMRSLWRASKLNNGGNRRHTLRPRLLETIVAHQVVGEWRHGSL
jgi:hypothetical protein